VTTLPVFAPLTSSWELKLITLPTEIEKAEVEVKNVEARIMVATLCLSELAEEINGMLLMINLVYETRKHKQ
jgi:hypothetical protein